MFTICVFDVFIYVFYSHRDIYSIVLHVCNVFVYLRYEYTSYTHIIDSSVCILYILHIYPIHIYIFTSYIMYTSLLYTRVMLCLSMVPRIQRSPRPSPPVQLRTLHEGRLSSAVGGRIRLQMGCPRKKHFWKQVSRDNWAYP